MAFKDQQNLSKVEILFYKNNSYFLELRICLNILIWILQVSRLSPPEAEIYRLRMYARHDLSTRMLNDLHLKPWRLMKNDV